MWTPVTLQPISPRPGRWRGRALFNTYALGWDVRDYHGVKIVWHGGAVLDSRRRWCLSLRST